MGIEEQIRAYVLANFLFSDGEYPFRDDDSFLEEGLISSIGVLELVLFVEENFNVTVDDQEVVPDNFDSVNKLAAYIRRKTGISG